jgi:hypothetical protein
MCDENCDYLAGVIAAESGLSHAEAKGMLDRKAGTIYQKLLAEAPVHG